MRYLVLIAVLASLGCGHTKPVPTPQTGTCAEVCEHGSAMGCTWATPTRNGVSCLEVCRNASDDGLLRWDLGCRARAVTCDVEAECP